MGKQLTWLSHMTAAPALIETAAGRFDKLIAQQDPAARQRPGPGDCQAPDGVYQRIVHYAPRRLESV